MSPAVASQRVGAYSGLRRVAPARQAGLAAGAPARRAAVATAVVAIAEPPSRPLEVQSQRPKPQVPDGTPVVTPLDLPLRPRRNRRSPTVRSAFREARAQQRAASAGAAPPRARARDGAGLSPPRSRHST